eukprot:386487_1
MTDALDPDHEEEKQQTRKSIHDAKVQMLLDMGFNEPDTTVALQQSNGDITLAAQYLINAGHVMNFSPNDIETAYGEVQLRVNERMEQEGRMLTESEISDVMMKMNLRRVKAIWNKWEKENNVSLSITQCFVENAKQCKYVNSLIDSSRNYEENANMSKILNAFHHSMYCHDINDFEYIYESIGGQCELNQCDALRRQNRSRNEENENDFKHRNDFYDTIHCHYRHQHDLFRLTTTERQDVEDEKEEGGRIRKLKRILNQKKERFRNEIASKRFDENNKFATDLGQMHQAMSSYSYSYRFHYWTDNDTGLPLSLDNDTGYSSKELYVGPRYDTLKTELLYNPIATLSLFRWNNYMKKTNIQMA